MRAVVLHKLGGPEELLYQEVPDPEPRPDECVVRVRAAGVCGRDLILRRGAAPLKKLPMILGHEFSGEIVRMGAIAAADSGLELGDRVINLHRPSCAACTTCLSKVPMLCE